MTAENSTESFALDSIEELVAREYPKGTQNSFGKALRHELHKAGRLNEKDPEGPFIIYTPIGDGFDVYVVETWEKALELREERGIIRHLERWNAGVQWGRRLSRESRFYRLTGEVD